MVKKSLPTSEMIDSADKFEDIYKSNAPLIYRFMFWRTKDKMLAEDLTSSVFEKAWRGRAGFTGGSTKSWLYKIAHNTLIDYWRKKKDLSADDAVTEQLVSNDASLDQALDRDIALANLQTALTKLPLDVRQVVELRFIEGQSCRQVAARLGMSEANVRVVQYRALRKLRGYLE